MSRTPELDKDKVILALNAQLQEANLELVQLRDYYRQYAELLQTLPDEVDKDEIVIDYGSAADDSE